MEAIQLGPSDLLFLSYEPSSYKLLTIPWRVSCRNTDMIYTVYLMSRVVPRAHQHLFKSLLSIFSWNMEKPGHNSNASFNSKQKNTVFFFYYFLFFTQPCEHNKQAFYYSTAASILNYFSLSYQQKYIPEFKICNGFVMILSGKLLYATWCVKYRAFSDYSCISYQ